MSKLPQNQGFRIITACCNYSSFSSQRLFSCCFFNFSILITSISYVQNKISQDQNNVFWIYIQRESIWKTIKLVPAPKYGALLWLRNIKCGQKIFRKYKKWKELECVFKYNQTNSQERWMFFLKIFGLNKMQEKQC